MSWAITRSNDTDDDGTGTVGTIHNAAWKTAIYDAVDGTSIHTRDVTTNDVVNTAAETSVFSVTIAANSLGSTLALRLSLIGDYLNNSGASRNLTGRVKYGGTSFAVFAWTTITADANRRALIIECVLSAHNATNAQAALGRGTLGGTNTAQGTDAVPFETRATVRNNHAIDSTVNQTFEVTLQHSAADANLSARALAVHLEKV